MSTKKKSPLEKKAPTARKAAPKKAPVRKRSIKTMKGRHAKLLVEHVNGLLAEHGFSGQVSELHFVSTGADSMGCVNCLPPSVCKRVCSVNNQGELECENRCVPPQ